MEYLARETNSVRMNVTRDVFNVPYFTQNSPPILSFVNPLVTIHDFAQLKFGSGKIDVIKKVTLIRNGCNPMGYVNVSDHVVFLTDYSYTCSLVWKLDQVQRNGGVSLVLLNHYQVDHEEYSDKVIIPCFTLMNDSGITEGFLTIPNLEFHIISDVTTTIRAFYNLILEDSRGLDNSSKVLLFGTNMDSDTPSINEYVTGVAALLEIIRNLSQIKEFSWRLRFIFWSYKEISSEIYFAKNNVTQYIHLNSLASQNGIFTIFTSPMDSLMGTYLNNSYTPYQKMEYSFQGHPTGGLTTNPKNGLKSFAEKQQFGGIANVGYDPCYRKQCDTLSNVDRFTLQESINTICDFIEHLMKSEVQ